MRLLGIQQIDLKWEFVDKHIDLYEWFFGLALKIIGKDRFKVVPF